MAIIVDLIMPCFDNLELKEFQALPAVALRQRFNAEDLQKLTKLFETALDRGFKRHGRLHWKVYLHTDSLIQVRHVHQFQWVDI